MVPIYWIHIGVIDEAQRSPSSYLHVTIAGTKDWELWTSTMAMGSKDPYDWWDTPFLSEYDQDSR